MDRDTILQLKVTELKNELSTLGLSTTGRKEELQQRLFEALFPDSPHNSPNMASNTAMSNNAPVSYNTATNNNTPTDPVANGGQCTPSKINLGSDPMSVERLKIREQRFGVALSSKLIQAEEDEAKMKRAQRFSQSQ